MKGAEKLPFLLTHGGLMLKVYDTGGFAANNPEQFDIATDWSNRNGR